jgi:hypothetical protein
MALHKKNMSEDHQDIQGKIGDGFSSKEKFEKQQVLHEEIILLVQEIWARAPEWRFGQVIENAFGECTVNQCLYHQSDESFAHLLQSMRDKMDAANGRSTRTVLG